jgi:hypothetical protein
MDLRQEAEHIFGNGFDWYQSELGEVVFWHEFLSMQSAYNDTYDEGGRRYSSGLLVPVLWVIVNEDRHRPTPEGRKPTEKLTCAVSARALQDSGISDPEDYTRRLNDLVRYDDRLWRVTDFNIRGRVPDSIIVGVTATQIFPDEEMSFDTMPPGVTASGVTRRYAYPNERQLAAYPQHELPAPNGTDMYSYQLYKDFDTNPEDDGPPTIPTTPSPGLFSINVVPDETNPFMYSFTVNDDPDHHVDWDYGDGATDEDRLCAETMVHTYDEAGHFVVTAYCHKETVTADVEIAPGPGYGLGQYGIVQPYGGYPQATLWRKPSE